jgi:GGDEF domain-containing protein
MIRALLILLAALVAVLAFVLDRPLLYAAAGGALIAALALVVRRVLSTSRRNDGRRSRSGDREEPMENLGIMEVRPQERGKPDPGGSSQGGRGSSPAGTGEEPAAADRRASSVPGDGPSPEPAPSEPAPSATGGAAAEDAPDDASSPPSADAPSSAKACTSDGAPASREAERGSSGDPDPPNARPDAPLSPDPPPSSNGTSRAESDPHAPASDEPPSAGEASTPVTTTPVEAAPVLAPYTASIRAALGARTVCVLVQEDVLLEYEIRSIASTDPNVRTSGIFSTRDPLLTATMTQQPVTIRPVDGEEAVSEYLKYYRSPAPVDHVALAPVRRPDDPSAYFLLADAGAPVNLDTTEARTLLEHFAQTLALILDADHVGATPEDGSATVSHPADAADRHSAPTRQPTTASEAAAAEKAAAAEASREAPRPRREIVAEEMQAADAAQEPLALVLVHLNRAQRLAQEGDDVVAAGERRLRARLEDAAPGARVTRFGELTYGVFYRGDVGEVEPWAADLQRELADETGILEGGVSIGIAMRSRRHDGDPESFRGDATEALRQAYESGAATIIE